MNNSEQNKTLQTIALALKKIFHQLNPQTHPLAFTLLIGKTYHGKTTFLNQSNLIHCQLEHEKHINIFYNKHGVILELNEIWLNANGDLIDYSLKKINNCYLNMKINGLMLCIDTSELLSIEPNALLEYCKNHIQLLKRFGQGLGYRTELAIVFTKMDTLTGFCEFIQSDHQRELLKPFGFSICHSADRKQVIADFNLQFDSMLESLEQQIINKIHPVRSTAKRTIIREFPLQLASLRALIQTIVQNINSKLFHLQPIYLTSAKQGGITYNKLNQKIQHEYALTIQNTLSQANNHRAYFIQGAIRHFQELTKQPHPHLVINYKIIASIAAISMLSVICHIGYQHITTTKMLDQASQELFTYETLFKHKNTYTTALYHLSKASNKLNLIPTSIFTNSIIEPLKIQLNQTTKHQLQENFLPTLIMDLRTVMQDPNQTPLARYQALRIYLMLNKSQHYSQTDVIHWFADYWHNKHASNSTNKAISILKMALRQPLQPIAIDMQLVSDVRNYLNSLPASYLYYSISKQYFPQSSHPIHIYGFSTADQMLPSYYTKNGFKQVMDILPKLSKKLLDENWILKRQDLQGLETKLEQAYYFEYVAWWKNFISNTHPQHFKNYIQALQLTKLIDKHNAIAALIKFIQQETCPKSNEYSSTFNQNIASKFAPINLLNVSTIRELSQSITELNQFLSTLVLVHDDGQTVFELTKSRFANENSPDPLSRLYNHARQLPPPVATWTKQLADDIWFIFIADSKQYLNDKWHQLVYYRYTQDIANHYPFDLDQINQDITMSAFDSFFSPQGTII